MVSLSNKPSFPLFMLLLGSMILSVLPFQSTVSISVDRKRMANASTMSRVYTSSKSSTLFAQISQQEAQKAIDKVVQALRKDSAANQELGKLQKVTTVLGFGSPQPETVAVRFNASFQKSGFGRSSVPLPFGLGQSNKSEGRGTMVGQVKASVNQKTGKIVSVSVFRDLGYGRSFNLKV
ncbi:hypothetical protein IV203_001501 [Nitzschia inconspicua]|uniref:Uncharacterized protein n=1 Tax=Nitzschia inconspicua TaxID=303405 RepID=A0A9K3PR23_9STRA|nr:hypothetical protein IV203_001501 [Nitzschia inconspicua]